MPVSRKFLVPTVQACAHCDQVPHKFLFGSKQGVNFIQNISNERDGVIMKTLCSFIPLTATKPLHEMTVIGIVE